MWEPILIIWVLILGQLVGGIRNGAPVSPKHSRPYVVQRLTTGGGPPAIEHGVIIDRWTVVTSSYEINGLLSIIRAGKFFRVQNETGQQDRRVCRRVVHPDAKQIGNVDTIAGIKNDWALIHMKEPFNFDDGQVQPIGLPRRGSQPTDCWVAGWGSLGNGQFPEELQERQVKYRVYDDCRANEPTIACVEEGPCGSDVGAPLICKEDGGENKLYGVMTSDGLGGCRFPAFANYLLFPRDWLETEQVQASIDCLRAPPPPPPSLTGCCPITGSGESHSHGRPTIPHSRPYLVQVIGSNSAKFLGFIINAYTVLMSAESAKGATHVIAGKHLYGRYEPTQQKRSVCSVSVHPNFQANTFAYALLHLSDPFILNEFVNFMPFAPVNDVPSGDCTIIAWLGTAEDAELWEQTVRFRSCENNDNTIACLEKFSCLHQYGAPIVCSKNGRVYLQAVTPSSTRYCSNGQTNSMAGLPRSWLESELANGLRTCGWCDL